MIVKAMTSRKTDGWRYYAADEVQCYKDDYKTINLLPRDTDGVKYIKFSDDCGDCSKWAVISFEGSAGPIEIMTNLPVFMLNEKGETIDRLN